MFFIFDCNGSIIGNPKGYKTHKGAQTQCEKQGKIRTAIFTAHHLREWPLNAVKHLYAIRWVDQPKSEAAQIFDNAFNNPVEFLRKHFTVINIQ
jgi:hypothetical protein